MPAAPPETPLVRHDHADDADDAHDADPDYYEDGPEFDPADLPPVDLEIVRSARREQSRFEASDAYGPDPLKKSKTIKAAH